MAESKNWIDVIHKMYDESRRLSDEFDKECRKTKPHSSFEEFDYWKSEDGIMRVRRFPNGRYDRHSLRNFSETEVLAMMKAFCD